MSIVGGIVAKLRERFKGEISCPSKGIMAKKTKRKGSNAGDGATCPKKNLQEVADDGQKISPALSNAIDMMYRFLKKEKEVNERFCLKFNKNLPSRGPFAARTLQFSKRRSADDG